MLLNNTVGYIIIEADQPNRNLVSLYYLRRVIYYLRTLVV
eukprot:COSAG01_NODE_2941_length_6819_cov_55.795536_4_plen_40_part_00